MGLGGEVPVGCAFTDAEFRAGKPQKPNIIASSLPCGGHNPSESQRLREHLDVITPRKAFLDISESLNTGAFC
jgi:hypothetical protein